MFDWRLILEMCYLLIVGEEHDAVMAWTVLTLAGVPGSRFRYHPELGEKSYNQTRTASVTLFALPAPGQHGRELIPAQFQIPLEWATPGPCTSTGRGQV